MSLFSKIGGAISKGVGSATSVVKKISQSPIASAAIGLIPGGNVAKAAVGFVGTMLSKGESSVPTVNIEPQNPVAVSSEMKNRSIAAKAAAANEYPQTGSKFKDFMMKAWTFIKANWLYVVPAVLVVFFLLVKFFWMKKPVRRKSTRRVAAAHRARAARAAKRRK